MRKLIIAAVAVLVLAGVGAGGWWGYHRVFRDPLKTARALLAHGQVQAAALELRDAVQRDPGNAQAQVRLAAVQLLLGDWVAAEKELTTARAEGYKGTDLTPLLARALLAQRRGPELLAQFSPDGLPPADAAELLVTRGLAQLAAGDADAARGSAEAAERLAPTLAMAPLLAARAAVAARQPGWAIACLDRALRINPRLTDALLLKAGVLRAESRPAEALAVLDQAAAAATAPLDVASARLSRAGALLAEGEDAKAMADLVVLLKQVPKSPGGNYLKALAEVRAGDWTAADATLQVIQPLLPRLPRGEYYLALIKTNLNQLEQASDAIGHYTARVPGDLDGWRLLARIDLLAGRRDDAAAVLARVAGLPLADRSPAAAAAAEAQADTPQELTQLASLQLGAGASGAAAHDLERSLDVLPTPADIAARAVMAALREGDIDRAATSLETLVRQPKVSAERLAALTGAVKVAQLDLDGARTAFADGIRAAPDSVPLKLDLARVLVLQNRPAQAEALLTPILQAAPASPLALATMLDLYAASGQSERVRATLAAARAAQPDNPALLLTEAMLTARGGDAAGALVRLETASPGLAQAPSVLALRVSLLLGQHKLKEAIAVEQQLLQTAPGNVAVRRELIGLLLTDHQSDAALALAREGLQARPGNSALLQAYVTAVYRISGLDAALELATTLRRDPVNLPAAQLLKGTVEMVAGRPADAAAAFAAERAAAPFGTLIIAEATALKAAGQTDQARALLAGWVAKAADPTVSDALASLEIESRHLDAAAAALKDVLALRPDDPTALNNLAWVYQQQGDAQQAVALARRAYLIAPGGQTADTLGWLLTRQGQPAIGLLLLRQAATRLPTDPGVHYHLAVALNDTGDHQQAGALLTAILAQKASFDERDAALQLQRRLLPDQPVSGQPVSGQPVPAAATQ